MNVKRCLGRLRRKIRLLKTVVKESFSTLKYSTNDDTETEMLLLSHSLEKGMGIKNVKKGYGIQKALSLIEFMKTYPNKDRFEYKESAAVLDSYISYQGEQGVEISDIVSSYEMLDHDTDLKGGVSHYTKNELLFGQRFDFESFVKSRHSIREYSNELVDRVEIERAIDMALYSPSACNRQPSKFYYSLDVEINKKLGHLLMGNKGYEEDIPYYGVVTSSKKLFSWHEAYQWYVNGGIFVANLVLAMHSLGIGSCIFQWPDFSKNEKALREIIGTKTTEEAVVAIIGFGKYPESAKCLKAQRRPIKDVVKEII